MYQGETLTVDITGFPIDISLISSIRIVFLDGKIPCLELTEEDCTFNADEQIVSFTLSQEQSLRINTGSISRRVIVVDKNGSRFEAKLENETVDFTAKREVIG